MKIIYILLVMAICPFSACALDNKPSPLWTNGKVTPEQPFKAKVVAAGGISPWSGETVIYLREDGGEGRSLEVRIGFATGKGVRYTVSKTYKKDLKELVDSLNKRGYGIAVFLDPVDISKFAWASPMGGVGRIFGDKDLVKMAYTNPTKIQNKIE